MKANVDAHQWMLILIGERVDTLLLKASIDRESLHFHSKLREAAATR